MPLRLLDRGLPPEIEARTQLMTLWEVEDNATRRFMGTLYRNLAAGMDRSEALRAHAAVR